MTLTSGGAMVADDWQSPDRPSWAGIGIGLAAYSICLGLVALAIGAYGLSLLIIEAHAQITGQPDETQAVLHAAVRGGAAAFLLAVLGGAILTPLGEELLFRGIIANALNRYGALAGIGASALIFGIAHGTGVVLWVAIMAGLISGALFRRTGSVWPSFLLHAVYNGLHSVASAMS